MLKNQDKIIVLASNLKPEQPLFFLNPILNNTEITESVYLIEVTRFSILTGSALIPDITIQLQVPTKIIRSSSDIHNDPITSGTFTSLDTFFGVTSHQFQAAKSPILQFKRTQRNRLFLNQFTYFSNQLRKIQTVTNHSNRQNDKTFTLNTITTTVSNL